MDTHWRKLFDALPDLDDDDREFIDWIDSIEDMPELTDPQRRWLIATKAINAAALATFKVLVPDRSDATDGSLSLASIASAMGGAVALCGANFVGDHMEEDEFTEFAAIMCGEMRESFEKMLRSMVVKNASDDERVTKILSGVFGA